VFVTLAHCFPRLSYLSILTNSTLLAPLGFTVHLRPALARLWRYQLLVLTFW